MLSLRRFDLGVCEFVRYVVEILAVCSFVDTGWRDRGVFGFGATRG